MSLNGSNIVFVGGIHGVGKTTICERAAKQFEIVHLVAGHIIRERVRSASDGGKGVESVDDNQDALVTGLSTRVSKGQTLLLDGHFALLMASGKIQRIPFQTYESIAPSAVLLIKDDPQEIAFRLNSRDGKRYEASDLAHLQLEEEANAKAVCERLSTPLVVAHPNDGFEALVGLVRGHPSTKVT